MVQLVKSTKDFEIFGAQPWHRQGEHRKFKSRSDFSQMLHFGPATAVFRLIVKHNLSAMTNKTLPKSKKKHPWRACPYGEHWRHGGQVSEHQRQNRRVRPHFRKGSCVRNATGRDQLYLEEILEISGREFGKLKGAPASIDLGYKAGKNYDKLIRGWVKYWNDVLRPIPKLDANLVKALIATESGFRESVETKIKDEGKKAYGLMQVLGNSFEIMKDEHGEIKDHYLNILKGQYKEPSANIAAGVRWLVHKFELYKKNHPAADWIDAIAKYKKLPRTHKIIHELEDYYRLLSAGEPSE